MATETMQPHEPRELKLGPEMVSDAELLAAVGAIATTIFHPVSTARMGTDTGAVVGADLRVRCVQGLRIADSSVMPMIPWGNTHAPITMIAEKASDIILTGAR